MKDDICSGELNSQSLEVDEALLETLLKDFRRDGCMILKDVFSKDFVQALYLHFINRYYRYFVDENHADALKVGDKRYLISVEIMDVFNSPQLYANPIIMAFMRNVFDNSFIISDITCVTSLPGAKSMGVHRDGGIFIGHPLSLLLPPHAVGVLIPLIPFNQQNGTTRVWPGTHRREYSQNEFSKLDFVDMELDTGSCVIMDHRIMHSGNANFSKEIRPLLYINYSTPWYFDPLNFHKQAPLILDDSNFKLIPKEYRKLFDRRQIRPIGEQSPSG